MQRNSVRCGRQKRGVDEEKEMIHQLEEEDDEGSEVYKSESAVPSAN
jgi:hypothetical protein